MGVNVRFGHVLVRGTGTVERRTAKFINTSLKMFVSRSLLSCTVLAVNALTLLPPSTLVAQSELFVATTGNDSNPGTKAEPLATLNAARERVASLRAAGELQAQAVTVTVAGGLYLLPTPLAFNEADSGTGAYPVTYRAADGAEVVLRAGVTLDQFHSVADEACDYPFPDKTSVWRIDLSKLTLPALDDDIRRLRTRTLYREMESEPIHLVVDQHLQTLARWPSSGWAQASEVNLEGTTWSVETNELGNSNFPNGPHAWAHGFWQNDWEDACHAVEFATTARKTNFRFCDETECGVKAGARFRIENLATQLDADHEWFLDADAKQAYVFHSNAAPQQAFVPQLTCPLSFYGVSHFNFVGFTIDGATNCGVEIAGGEQVTLRNCEIRNVGNTCVHIYHGRSHAVTDCELHDSGAGGVRIEAGDRATLTPAEHRISGNHIHHYSHCHLAYRPAVNAIGVGITIEDNSIHDGPHAAIILEGNEHVVANNEISQVCLETDDVGAVYIGGNPTFRGNRIVGNHIHDVGAMNRKGVVGIYLDDFTSGTTVSDNVLQRMPRGIVIGGGRDNLVTNNIVLDCLAAIQADARGTTWAADFVATPDSTYVQLCREVENNEAYLTRYPQLATLIGDTPQLPKGNQVASNWIDCPIAIDLQGDETKHLVISDRNVQKAYRYLVELGNGMFELNAAGEALLNGEDTTSLTKSRYIRRVDPNFESSPSDRPRLSDVK